ncbi:Glycoprotein endo-alpha-1,2-mannosidase-like protein [Seminavis robusta]|uniref:Glycoprotein endo-alpha-1,2-mannosidase-like protein n=1 Tax=Seminavis robusta TaxID=568900 RepID=A0A9N8EJY9_9STRA|nr:Glycoprotein endo-alpha-1,2-mannosidase-like protein [Seminavis robusta]|eukprot:Sro1199_g251760.1 Glycoprotein endo-alpha-1,2-mannosidase-like protein (410) ;mRNA; r:19385-20693
MVAFPDWTVGSFLESHIPSWLLPFCCNAMDARPVSIGAYYYPWWDDATNKHWPEGYLRENLSPVHEPLLGHYSVRDTAVIDQHFQWAKDYGINLFVASWWGRDSFEDITLRDYMFPSSNLGDLKIALFYESFGLLAKNSNNQIDFDDTANQQKLISDLSYMAETYFGHSNYFTIHDKAVVFFYVTRVYTGNYRHAFDAAKAHIQSSYDCELYLIGDEVWWSDPVIDRIATFDAITAYNLHGPSRYNGYPEATGFIQESESLYKNYQDVAKDCHGKKVDLIPGVLPAFNDRGVRLETDHYVIPHEVRAELAGSMQYSTFWESLAMAYRVIQCRSNSNSNDPTAIIMVTSFNEWHEDTNIEPTKATAASTNEPFLYTQGYTVEDYGFKLLELIPKFLNEVVAAATHGESVS